MPAPSNCCITRSRSLAASPTGSSRAVWAMARAWWDIGGSGVRGRQDGLAAAQAGVFQHRECGADPLQAVAVEFGRDHAGALG
ncbi:hypothetical protein JCM19379_17390 [Methyloparacoccus murrellii]